MPPQPRALPRLDQQARRPERTLRSLLGCGILAPLFKVAGAPVAQPMDEADGRRIWLDQAAIHAAQPGLSSEVVGGWWLPEEGQVDNRALLEALRQAAESLGSTFKKASR